MRRSLVLVLATTGLVWLPAGPVGAAGCDESGGGSAEVTEGGGITLIGGGEKKCIKPKEFVPYTGWETYDIYPGPAPSCPEGMLKGVRVYYEYTSPTTKKELYLADGCVPDPRPGDFVPGLIGETDVRAVLQGQLPMPSVARDPYAEGLVQLETYLWYEGGGLSQITPPGQAPCEGYEMHATEGAIELDAWVCVTGYEWDMGNGDTVTADRPGSAEDPAAEYVYEQTGTYDLVASTVWRGWWSVSWGGGSEPMTPFGAPIVMSSSPEPFTVYQVRAVPKTRE